MFRLLKALRRPHGPVLRACAAGGAALVVLVVQGRPALAREAAGLFWRDDWVIGMHRLRWHLHHGWTRALLPAAPAFDPTTGMDLADVTRLDQALTGQVTVQARLAQLAVLARLVADSADATAQTRAQDRYVSTAQKLVGQIAPPDRQARPDKGRDFTLVDATAALASLEQHLNLPWFIISGTFLGCVREGGFLSHDYDIDIGVHAADFDAPRLIAALDAAPDLVLVADSPAGTLTPRPGGGWDMQRWPALYTVMHQSGLMIDIFIHHTEDGDCWHGSAKHRWSNTPFDLAPYPLAGITVQGPADADRYLTENYGDWRTPVTQFDCSTGTPNVTFQRNLSAITAFLRTAVLEPGSADAAVAVLVLQQIGYLDADRTRFSWP